MERRECANNHSFTNCYYCLEYLFRRPTITRKIRVRLKDCWAPETRTRDSKEKQRIGAYDEAIKILIVATKIDPKFVSAYNQMGFVFFEADKKNESAEAFKKAIQENPNYISAYLNLGNAYGNTGRYEESIASYKEGIQLNSRHPQVPQMEMNIASIAYKMNDKKTAVIYAQKAIQSYTDRNDLEGVAKAAAQLRMIEIKVPKKK